jgi:phosphoribosyl-dephospho-CoA transferase
VIETLRRHDLLRIDPAGWQRVLAQQPELATRPYVSDWAERGWPVIVRRYANDEAADLIPVAISVPPPAAKPGIALALRASDILERMPAVALSACIGQAPAAWRETLQSLIALAERCGTAACVFGSLLWQTLTGLTYLHAGSDVDLLWAVMRREQAQDLACGIARCALTSAMRIDGELLLPDGAGIHWREWQGGADEVLVRTLHRVERRAVGQLLLDHSDSHLSIESAS